MLAVAATRRRRSDWKSPTAWEMRATSRRVNNRRCRHGVPVPTRGGQFRLRRGDALGAAQHAVLRPREGQVHHRGRWLARRLLDGPRHYRRDERTAASGVAEPCSASRRLRAVRSTVEGYLLSVAGAGGSVRALGDGVSRSVTGWPALPAEDVPLARVGSPAAMQMGLERRASRTSGSRDRSSRASGHRSETGWPLRARLARGFHGRLCRP